MDAFEQQQDVTNELFKPDITHNQQNNSNPFEDHELNNGRNLIRFHSMEEITCPCCEKHDCKHVHQFHGYKEKNLPGFRFNPKDDELISDYLQPRIRKGRVPGASNSAKIPSLINEVFLYKFSPEELSVMYPPIDDDAAVIKEWYFFTPRDRKYLNGFRPNRAAGNGYWKATGADKKIYNSFHEEIGRKKSLVFYVGKPPKGTKSNWIMHEYRVEPKPEAKKEKQEQCVADHVMRLDDSVLCKIYKKESNATNKKESKRESKKRKAPVEDELDIRKDFDNSYLYNYDPHEEDVSGYPFNLASLFGDDINLDILSDDFSNYSDYHLPEVNHDQVPFPMSPSSSLPNHIPQETSHDQLPNQTHSKNTNAIPAQEVHHPQFFNPGQPRNNLPPFANTNPQGGFNGNNGLFSNFPHDDGFARLHVRNNLAAWNPFCDSNNMHVGQQQSLVGMYGGQNVQNVPLGQLQNVFGGRPMMSQNMATLPDQLQGAIGMPRVPKMPSPEEKFSEGTSDRNGSGGRKRMKRESRANEVDENLNP